MTDKVTKKRSAQEFINLLDRCRLIAEVMPQSFTENQHLYDMVGKVYLLSIRRAHRDYDHVQTSISQSLHDMPVGAD